MKFINVIDLTAKYKFQIAGSFIPVFHYSLLLVKIQ